MAILSAGIHFSVAGDIYVSGAGDDGWDGSAATPYRSITKAVSVVSANDIIHIDEGTYDTANNESFPITVSADIAIVGWSQSGAAIDPTLRIVTGDNATASLFSVANGVTFSISDCVLRDTSNATVAMGDSTTLFATNVTFTQSVAINAANTDFNGAARFAVGSVRSTADSTMEFQSCQFLGMNRDIMLMNYNGNQNTTFTLRLYDCLVSNNTVKYGNIAEAYGGSRVVVDAQRTVFRENRQTNNGGQHDAFGAAILWTRGNYNAYNYTSFSFDRCQFLGNIGRSLFGVNNVSGLTISNSLFAGNDITGYTIGGYRGNCSLLNCTMIGGGKKGGLAGRLIATTVRNSILAGYRDLQFSEGWTSSADNLLITDSIVYDCTLGLGVHASSSYLTDDPLLENVAVAWDNVAFDPRPRAYSPAIDAANATYVSGGLDLAGSARVADNDSDGVAAADYGCYESLFHAAVSPTFSVPVPGYKSAIRGQTISIPVSIDAGASIAAPVIAAVTYPTGITGDATLSFANGSASDTLTFTVAADAPDGLLRISIAESGTSEGVLPALYDVAAADLTLTLGKTHIYLPAGDTADLPVRLSSAGAVTPTAITVTTSAIAGAGTSTATWAGANTIPVDSSATEGALHIVAGIGVNTVALSIDTGTFVESDSATTTLTIVGHDGTLYVDAANGDDATAIGIAGGTPFQSISAALANLSAGTLSIGPGTYAPSTTGETYPLKPGAVHLQGVSPEVTILDAENGADSVVAYDAGQSGSVSDLAMRRSSNSALYLFGADCAVTNCAFTQTTASNDNPGGIWAREDSHVIAVGCVFTNMTRRACVYATQLTATSYGDRSVTLEDCLFQDNDSDYGAVATYPSSYYAWNLDGCDFIANRTHRNFNVHDSAPASCIWVELNQNTLRADRCRFLGNAGNHLIGCNWTTLQFASCLFAENNPSISMVQGYTVWPYFRNCTFVRNNGVYSGTTSGFNIGNSVVFTYSNSIFYGDGPLSASGGDGRLKLSRCIIDSTTHLGSGYSELVAGTVVTADPLLENVATNCLDAAFDARPRPYSPAIDLADTDAQLGVADLDGNARVADNNDDGVAKADLGCYESLFHAAVEPTPYLPLPGHASAFRGGTATIPVSIDPAAAAYPVTLAVSYGEGLSGAATLVFADAATTNELVVTVAADAPDAARISFADAAIPAAILPAVFDLVLGDMSLAIGGDTTINVREGDTLDLPVSIALADTVAPQSIGLVIGSVLGNGTSDIAWQGPAAIPAGSASSAGFLRIVGGQGVNTITITGDYLFEESGSTQVTLTIVAYPGYLYVDAANGSDATGTGLAAAPFQTITHAIVRLSTGDELRILPGTYSEAIGEVFPLQPAGVALRGWDGTGDADPATVVIDGTNGVPDLVSYGFGAYTGLVVNLTLRETTEAALVTDNADVTVRNCRFTQSVANASNYRLNTAGGILAKNGSHTLVEGCTFDGIQRLSAVQVNSTDATMDFGGTMAVVDCLFTNCVSSLGTVAIYQARSSIGITNCVFAANDTPLYDANSGWNNEDRPGNVHDSLAASAIYLYGPGANTTIRSASIDRCSFLGNTGNVLIGAEYIANHALPISNCLFADNQPRYGMVSGYWFGPAYANCTFVRNAGNYVARYDGTMRNSILYCDGPTTTNFPGAIHQETATITLSSNIVWRTSAGDRTAFDGAPLEVDPQLRNADVNVFAEGFDARLRTSSPALNAAYAAYVMGDCDLDGNARILFGATDLGCYESTDAGGMLFLLR